MFKGIMIISRRTYCPSPLTANANAYVKSVYLNTFPPSVVRIWAERRGLHACTVVTLGNLQMLQFAQQDFFFYIKTQQCSSHYSVKEWDIAGSRRTARSRCWKKENWACKGSEWLPRSSLPSPTGFPPIVHPGSSVSAFCWKTSDLGIHVGVSFYTNHRPTHCRGPNTSHHGSGVPNGSGLFRDENREICSGVDWAQNAEPLNSQNLNPIKLFSRMCWIN